MKNLSILYLVIFLLAIFSPEVVSAQCSMCRAVLESEEGQVTAKGINDGIVYLMAMPYILVTVVGFVVYKMMYK